MSNARAALFLLGAVGVACGPNATTTPDDASTPDASWVDGSADAATDAGADTGGPATPGILQLGPGGDAFTNEVVIDPTNPQYVYISSDNGGFMRSEDGGDTWERIIGEHGGLLSQKIVGIELDPTDPSTLYVSTMGGIWKSTDRGKTFVDLHNGLPAYGYASGAALHANAFSAIKISPFDRNVIYIGAGSNTKWRTKPDYLVMGYRSLDGGKSWSPLGLTGGPVLSKGYSTAEIAVGSKDGNTVYYAGMNGIFKSVDGGGSWSKIADSRLQDHVMAIDAVKDNPSIVYAAKGMNSGSDATYGLYKSIDAGNSWTKMNPGGAANARVMEFRITDDSGQTIYAMFGSTIYKTADGGTTWSCYSYPYNTGWATYFGVSAGLSFDVSRSNPLILFAGANVYIKTNGQPLSCDTTLTKKSWVPTYSTPANVAGFYKNTGQIMITGGWDVFVDPDDTQNVMVGGFDQGFSISKDGGLSWKNFQQIGTKTQTDGHDAGGFAKDDHGNFYVTYGGDNVPNAKIGLFTSTDMETWSLVHTFLATSTVQVQFLKSGATRKLFAIVRGAGNTSNTWDTGIWSSSNDGATWARLPGLPVYKGNQYPTGLAQDPTNPENLYATFAVAGSGGVWKSTDFGGSWSQVAGSSATSAMSDARGVTVGPKGQCVVGVRGSSGGVWMSATGDSSWTKIDTKLVTASSTFPKMASALTYTKDGKLVVGYTSYASSESPTNVNPLAITPDDGATWTELPTGSMVSEFGHIVADPVDAKVLWIATDGGGSFKYTMP